MKHLIYFPEPYPDEDFRSIIYRYHIRSGNVEFKDTKKELFDVCSYKLGLFPRNLSKLLNKIPYEWNLTKENFLSHTWFPLFEPFLEKNRLAIINNDIMFGKSGISNFVGRVATQRNIPVLSKEIKYCPMCMEEDYKKYGESYVHLKHQLAFLDFCSDHYIKLTNKCSHCGTYFSNQGLGELSIKPCCTKVKYEKVTRSRITDFSIRLLTECAYIKERKSMMNADFIYSKLMVVLGNNGYINIKGKVYRRKLVEDLMKKYQKDCPDLIDIIKYKMPIERISSYFFTPEHMSKLIIFYVLLIIFLSGTTKTFIETDESYSIPIPFGTGPWPCHNHICPSHQVVKPITKCERSYILKGFKGRFICPICGFEYEKKWTTEEKEIISENKYIIKKRGHLWNERVLELYNLGYKVDEIAIIVKSYKSNIQSVLRNYKKLKANNNALATKTKSKDAERAILLGQSEVATTETIKDKVRMNYRAKINNLKKIHKNLNRTAAYRLAQKEYKWLLRNDNEWLNHILPAFSLDYLSMDIDLRQKVRNIAKILYASNPPNRIRMYTILNRLELKEKNLILSHKEKLPKTVAEVESQIETIDDYQVRHVPVLISHFKSIGRKEKVTFNSIASVHKSYRNCSEETKKRIEEVLNKLQNDPI